MQRGCSYKWTQTEQILFIFRQLVERVSLDIVPVQSEPFYIVMLNYEYETSNVNLTVFVLLHHLE